MGTTNQEGNFELVGIVLGDTLSFSFIGYAPNDVIVSNFEDLQVTMNAQEGEGLDEVVVIGYGTQCRAEMTGSISSVRASDLEKVAAPSFTNAIQGKVPGVMWRGSTNILFVLPYKFDNIIPIVYF